MTMLFLVYALDNPVTGREIRKRTRAAHLRYVLDNKERVQYGGALLDDSGQMIGTIQIVRAEDAEDLDRFLAGDPYSKNGLFTQVVVRRATRSLPESRPGELADELAKLETEAR